MFRALGLRGLGLRGFRGSGWHSMFARFPSGCIAEGCKRIAKSASCALCALPDISKLTPRISESF